MIKLEVKKSKIYNLERREYVAATATDLPVGMAYLGAVRHCFMLFDVNHIVDGCELHYKLEKKYKTS